MLLTSTVLKFLMKKARIKFDFIKPTVFQLSWQTIFKRKSNHSKIYENKSSRKILNSRFSILSRTIFKYFLIGKIQEFVRKRNFIVKFSNLFLIIVLNKNNIFCICRNRFNMRSGKKRKIYGKIILRTSQYQITFNLFYWLNNK